MSESIKAPIARHPTPPGNPVDNAAVSRGAALSPSLDENPSRSHGSSESSQMAAGEEQVKRIHELQSEVAELRRALAVSQDSLQSARQQLAEQQEHESLGVLMKEISTSLQQRDDKLHGYVAELVSAATANVLGKMLTSPEYAVAAITNVLDKCNSDAVVSIKVSARDYQTMTKYRSQFPEFPFESLEVSGDIAVGGCQVFTATGMLDGALENQLLALRQIMSGKR